MSAPHDPSGRPVAPPGREPGVETLEPGAVDGSAGGGAVVDGSVGRATVVAGTRVGDGGVRRRHVEPALFPGGRWLAVAGLVVLVLAWSLTRLGPAALSAAVVVTSAATVRPRRLRSSLTEVALLVVAAGVGLLLVHDRLGLTGGALALQMVVGGAAGCVLVVAATTPALRRRG